VGAGLDIRQAMEGPPLGCGDGRGGGGLVGYSGWDLTVQRFPERIRDVDIIYLDLVKSKFRLVSDITSAAINCEWIGYFRVVRHTFTARLESDGDVHYLPPTFQFRYAVVADVGQFLAKWGFHCLVLHDCRDLGHSKNPRHRISIVPNFMNYLSN